MRESRLSLLPRRRGRDRLLDRFVLARPGHHLRVRVRATLELPAPAREDVVHARRAENRTLRNPEMLRMEDEGTRLDPADTTVEGDEPSKAQPSSRSGS